MIRFSNGHQFEYMTASGAMAFDGRGWWWERPAYWSGAMDPRLFTNVLKTLTRNRIKGEYRWWNPLRCARLIKNGTVNAVRLSNPGIDGWEKKYAKRALGMMERGVALVASILSSDLSDLAYLAVRLAEYPFRAIELNFSCPNTADEIEKNSEHVVRGCEKVRDAIDLPIIAKVATTHDIEWITPRVVGAVDAFDINSVSWKIVFPDQKSPLGHLGGGGVSGFPAQKHNWPFAERLSQLSDIPVIWPSVWWYEDLKLLREKYNAPAVSFGARHIPWCWKPTQYVRRELKERREAAKLTGQNADNL